MFCLLLKWESVKNMMVGKTVMASQFFYHNCSKLFLWWESFQSMVFWKIVMSSKFFDQNCSKTLLSWEFWRTKGIEKKRWFSQGFLIRKIQKKSKMIFLCLEKKNGICLPIFPSKLFQATSRTRIFWKHGVLRNIDFLPFFSIKIVPSLS